jgi:ribosome-binding protein aMBF1 (putative translation factor)
MLSKWNGSVQAGKDLDRLIELMAGQEELSVAQFCAKVDKALKDASSTPPSHSRRKKPDQELVTHYTKRLSAPDLRRDELEDIIFHLQKDKNCRLVEMGKIANTLMNSEKSYRSKKEAIQDIERYTHRRLDVGRRMEDTSSVF